MPSDVPRPEEMFRCRMCGDCCRGYGGTFISSDDIGAIASYLQLAPDDFTARYCRRSGKRLVLGQRDDGYCIFWDQLCRIHPVKPRMCRLWPFIESVLVDAENWKIMATCCPGMRTDIPPDRIQACVRRLLDGGNGVRGRPEADVRAASTGRPCSADRRPDPGPPK